MSLCLEPQCERAFLFRPDQPNLYFTAFSNEIGRPSYVLSSTSPLYVSRVSLPGDERNQCPPPAFIQFFNGSPRRSFVTLKRLAVPLRQRVNYQLSEVTAPASLCPGEFFTGEFVSEKETKGREGNGLRICRHARASKACMRACMRALRARCTCSRAPTQTRPRIPVRVHSWRV